MDGLFGGNSDVKKLVKAVVKLQASIPDLRNRIIQAIEVLELKSENVVPELRKALLEGFDGQKQEFEKNVLGSMSQDVEQRSKAIQGLEGQIQENARRLEEIQRLLKELEQKKGDAENELNELKGQVLSKRQMYAEASASVKQRLQSMLDQFSTLQ
jgi:chromosome segregation ATPase